MGRKAMPAAERLVRTSVQIPPAIVDLLDAWPGLTRSEALREALTRYFHATPDPADAYLHPLEWIRKVGKMDRQGANPTGPGGNGPDGTPGASGADSTS